MQADRTIGRAVKVKTYQALVELLPETSSYVRSSYGGLYAIAVINSFVIIPVGSERVVAVVTALDMAEETEASLQNRQMLVIARPRRTMWVTMIGTIVQGHGGGKAFEYGVRRYPELDNPVWFANEDDLDVIFDKASSKDARRVVIGSSPLFPDYKVSIDIDRFFGKHAAILGNTGAGKSCTVTAVIRAVLDGAKEMPNAHFLIFDTNNEYERAFTLDDGTRLYNRLVLRNQGDSPTGLWVPHWFMNSADFQAFFRPGEGAQAPLLFKAIGVARSRSLVKSALLGLFDTVESSVNVLVQSVTTPAQGNAAYHGKKNLREKINALLQVLGERAALFADQPVQATPYEDDLTTIRQTVSVDGPIDATVDVAVREGAQRISERLIVDRNVLLQGPNVQIGVDTPVHFDFDEFVNSVFPEELAREAQKDPRLRSYVGTLQLRLEQSRQDQRYRFLFGPAAFESSLASFLRLLFGVRPDKNFSSARPPWSTFYENQHPGGVNAHRVTILDLSELASEVLENVTALIGRLVLEFMQRNPDRGQFPVVLILEEAHHYIPARVASERQQRARDVFERIAKEGRKFGLSLVVASQRPSELSRTVLAQCNSFIVHRIQNPDDQEYFKSVISGINRELLDQLPSLAQQRAIVMGDCVPLPLQVTINTVSPRPHGPDPPFFDAWSSGEPRIPDFEAIARKWEGRGEGGD